MRKNEMYRSEGTIYRILDIQQEDALVIDCKRMTMPQWVKIEEIPESGVFPENELFPELGISPISEERLTAEQSKVAHERFTIIADILPHIGNKPMRNHLVAQAAESNNISRRTVTNYLCQYLVYQSVAVLAPQVKNTERELTQDEKNIRWALNKFFYTHHKNSLKTAYTMMLKEKYRDGRGILLQNYPSFDQFRYFYRKHNKMQTYYISRNGLKNYQRNERPLLGDGVQAFAPSIGVGMLDSTVCDIYLVDDAGKLVGRPLLTACVDAFSGLCCGYSLSWEGGNYSLRGLMLNVIADKVEHCKKHGIMIEEGEWPCSDLPATLVTDMGSEYKSENFEQIAELGVKLINLPAYRPELKGMVEKFFDLVQSSYKAHLKGKGVIEPDYQERGVHDYRKDACLTMEQFEHILLRCIIYYNSKRIMENYPYSEGMLEAEVAPCSNAIWNYAAEQSGSNLITMQADRLILTLLPRTSGKFSRHGLKANKLRYHCDGYTEQ